MTFPNGKACIETDLGLDLPSRCLGVQPAEHRVASEHTVQLVM